MNDSSVYVAGQQDANQSICPAGWRLPTYSGDKSYQNLVDVEGLTAGTDGNIQNSPTYSGYWFFGSLSNGDGSGSTGHYWSSVAAQNSDFSYHLYFNSQGGLLGQNDYSRNRGYTLRCVAR